MTVIGRGRPRPILQTTAKVSKPPGADPLSRADLRPVWVGLSSAVKSPAEAAPYDRAADRSMTLCFDRSSGGAGYPEGKKTERSEGPESLRYIAQPFELFESKACVARSMATRA